MKATAYAVTPPTREPALRRVSLAELRHAHIELPTDAVAHIIPASNVTLLGGHGGSGKSILAETIAAHFPSGTSWAGLAIKRGRAVFVTLEDPPTVVMGRLRRICDAYDLDLPTDEDLLILDGTNGDSALVTDSSTGSRELIGTAALEELRTAAKGAALVVIDNASDAYDADENHRRSVRGFIRRLAEIARESGAAVLLLAHIDKAAARNGSSGNSYSGSTAWHNSVRSRLALVERGPGLPGVELAHEKANLGRRIESILLRFDEHGVLMPYDGTSNQLVGESDCAAADAEAVLAALRAAEAADCNVPPGRTGAVTAHSALKTFDLPESLRGDRARFWRALNSLLADGRAASAEYKTGDHKTRSRIVAVPPNRLTAKPPVPPANSAADGAADPRNSKDTDSAAIRRLGGTDMEALVI